MAGELLVNGTDLYTEFGTYLTDGSLRDLLSFPESKAVETESYREQNGLKADLSSLKLKNKNISLSLGLSGDSGSIRGLYEFIGANPYATFSVPSIGLQKALRVKGISSIEYAERLSLCSVSLSDDSPSVATDATYVAPLSSLVAADNSYKLDALPFSSYGIVLTQGTENGVRNEGDVKTLLSRDISTVHGLIYDNGDIANTFSGCDCVINGVMYAASVAELTRNTNAFLYDLIREKDTALQTDRCKRTLSVADLGKSFQCYYRGFRVSDYAFVGTKILVQFSLTLFILDRGTAIT